MSANDPITTSVAHRDGIAVVTVGGEIDSFTAPALEAAIAEALAVDPTALIIELSTVTFLASAGLQILAATHAKSANRLTSRSWQRVRLRVGQYS